MQVEAFADAGVDLVTAITMTNGAEAIGIVEAARDGRPAGRHLLHGGDRRDAASGEALGEAVEAVDAATDGYAAYFMVNCAHPDHVAPVLDPGAAWTQRLGWLPGQRRPA